MMTDDDVTRALGELGFLPGDPGVGEGAIRALFLELAEECPTAYHSFLAATGGGEFAIEVVCRCEEPPPVAEGGLTLVGEFYSLSEIRLQTHRGKELAARHLVPVASAAGGDSYWLHLSEREPGVVFWDHDSGATYRVARSFEDFVSRLSRAPDRSPRDVGEYKLTLNPDLLRKR